MTDSVASRSGSIIMWSELPRRASPHGTECIVTPLVGPGTLVDASCISSPELPTRRRWRFGASACMLKKWAPSENVDGQN